MQTQFFGGVFNLQEIVNFLIFILIYILILLLLLD